MDFSFVNGTKIYSPSSKEKLIEFSERKKGILIAINAEKILSASAELKEIINQNIGYPDGIGAVMVLRQKGFKNVYKIAGCELWLSIVEKYWKKKSFYLIGSTTEVINETFNKLKTDYPDIRIIGHRNGYFNNENEINNLLSDIKAKQPDYVFVAMGSPKQELLMNKIFKSHECILQGLGGSFDVYTQKFRRAPVWFIKNNLEWFYRLVKQPLRASRQLKLMKFVIMYIFRKF